MNDFTDILGYILGGIPWAELGSSDPKESFSQVDANIYPGSNSSNISILNAFFYPSMANDHKQFLFSIVAVIYLICALISISSFKEIPLENLRNSDNSNGSSVKYEKMDEEMDDPEAINESQKTSSTDNLSKQANSKESSTNEYFKSIFKMPSSLKWLCLTHCFSWMSLLCFSLYFTDFVGEEIFGGDATENANFEDHQKYNKGVRMGSFCMAIYSISCSIYSFFLQFLMNRFRNN